MTDNVIKFFPADAYKDPDAVLEQAIGEFSDVLIIGWNKDGHMDVRATKGLEDGGDMLWLIEKFKFNMLAGAYQTDDD